MNNEFAQVGMRVDAVLEKFEGEVEDGIVVERIYLTDGVITKTEYLEDGEVIRTVEGGNNGTN